MWIAENWKDYEVIDCSKGEKLELGQISSGSSRLLYASGTRQNRKGWRKMNGHYHRSAKGGGEWEFSSAEQWRIQYGSLILT